MTTTGPAGATTRTPNPGYREHDMVSSWQECDTCGLRTGAGMTTEYDAAYYTGDPSVCPRCAAAGRDGLMCLPAEVTELEWDDGHDATGTDETDRGWWYRIAGRDELALVISGTLTADSDRETVLAAISEQERR